MKYLVLLLALGIPGWGWLSHIHRQNDSLAQAQAAYRQGRAAAAVTAFRQALAAGSSRAADPRLLLNLAHAQAQAGQQAEARATYGQLLSDARVPQQLASVARQQLAVLTAGQGNYVQALSLLRQALTLDPSNNGARYNYEVLREFLARRPAPQLPSPPATRQPQPNKKQPANPEKNEKQPAPAPKDQAVQNQPASRPGPDRPGQADDTLQPAPPAGAPKPRPDANGQPDPNRPAPSTGPNAAGGFRPGAGEKQPLPTGSNGGSQRGLNPTQPGTPAKNGRSSQPGTEQATDADQQFQTQRERLRQLNLTPAQARLLLEALRAQEQQYLQQRPRPSGKRLKPGQPTW